MLLRPMTEEECWALLESQRLCVLSVVDGGKPYAVPVFYGLDGTSVVLGISEGRKTRALDENPNACITVTEVRPDGFWRSAQLAGIVVSVAGESARQHAMQALIAHNRRLGGSPAPTGTTRSLAGRIVRIDNGMVSGRAKNSAP